MYAQFLDDIVINDGSPVIIPQGSKSVTFDWELGANFMLENGEIAEKFNPNKNCISFVDNRISHYAHSYNMHYAQRYLYIIQHYAQC